MRFTKRLVVLFVLVCLVPALQAQQPAVRPSDAAPPPDLEESYTVSRQDVLNITVIDSPEFTGKFTVETDGAIRYPYIGRVNVVGKTVRQIATQLKGLLAPDYLRNPQVAVNLDAFKGRKVFIWGAVGQPGFYPLTEGMTLMEAMVKAGYGSSTEVVILRTPTPTENPDNLVRLVVNLRELENDFQNGQMTRNIALQDGDKLFLSRTDKNRIFVTGEVKLPGAYSVPEGTTVLQAITMAGGVTPAAAVNRIKITRLIKGENKSIDVKIDAIVKPGDTIIVPERRM